VQLRAHGAVGTTDGTDVRRGIASLGVVSAFGTLHLRTAATAGKVVFDSDSSTSAMSFESFSIGGLAAPLFDEQLLAQRISVPAIPAASRNGKSFAAYRAALSQNGVPVALYAAWFKVYDPDGSWLRLVGAEGEQSFPSISFASLPNVSLHYGAAYSIDNPRRHRWTLYGGARFAP
jgi:hypothetical protein